MLPAARWRLVHTLGMELLDVPDPEAQVRAGLDALLRLVPGAVAAEVVVDLRTGASRVTEVPELLAPLAREDGRALLLSSPAVRHLVRHRDLPASRVEDLCTAREWARNPMRRELLDPRGVPHAVLAGRVDPAGELLGWGVNRGRPFDDEEVALLAAFEPFLRRAARDRRRTLLVLDLDRAVASGAGLVLFRGEEAVHVNAEAAALLERHALAPADLLRASRASLGPSRPSAALPTRAGALRLRWRPALPGAHAVVLDEAADGAAVAGALSPRQHAVLCHLSRGLTAAAIAHRLGISVRTVHKHLENVYRALGAADRLDAVLKGHELGLLPVVPDCDALEPR